MNMRSLIFRSKKTRIADAWSSVLDPDEELDVRLRDDDPVPERYFSARSTLSGGAGGGGMQNRNET